MTRKEAQERVDALRAKLASVFEEAGPDNDFSKVKSLEGDTAAKVEAVRKLNAELDEAVKTLDSLRDAERGRQLVADLGQVERPPVATRGAEPEGPKYRSFGEWFVASEALKGWTRGGPGPVARLKLDTDIELKTLMDTASGWPPESTRTGRVAEYPLRPIQVLDLIPQGRTSQNAVVYMEESAPTPAAAETAEAGAYPEAALALVEKSSAVRKIAVFLPVTDEQLEDVPQVESYINNRLSFFLRQRLDSQVLNGNGTAPNLRGILNTSGIQTQAKGADPAPDAVYKAIVKVRLNGRAEPDAVVVHPNDWQNIRLLRTADGLYIWGNPSESGPERIWGLPVVQADSLSAGTALVGDFAGHSQLVLRRDVEVQVGFVNDDFTKGKQAVRADMRAAFVVYRPSAYCTVTGL
jgi:HK97 family phage major capsid protein